ncbi:MAG: thioredoxin domain-containing protein [Opitutae bacterium]|nr:thioredoxin domain-containing protein [Opitutae bacterium]
MPNRLAEEQSPYLRQHAANPVDWQPWGEAALQRARVEQKPIFLSIGYSTCHWCHVMAHESFEDEEIAALLNAEFVPIKVDREERPDLDRVYMTYVQAMTGRGGWPLSVWLTPELRPFFGGTYFPPEDRHGRPGFVTVLRTLARAWRDQREQLVAEGERVLAALREHFGAEGRNGGASDRLAATDAAAASDGCYRYFEEAFDAVRGGFGGAPKFPRACIPAFLFRYAVRQGVTSDLGRSAIHLATHTLREMARGGIHDHVGGGFHRYSVDADWFVPHFEKMLYDQAQIAVNALEAWQATHDDRFAALARDLCDYVLRDLADPAGGFHAGEDADSATGSAVAAHAEGAYYVWSSDELRVALGDAYSLFAAQFGVTDGGNVSAARDPQGEFTGKNILAQVVAPTELASAFSLSVGEIEKRTEAALTRLRSLREQRPRPQRDDQVIAGWNGLMLSALARASATPAPALAERRSAYRAAALRLAEFLRRELFDPATGVLYRAWRERRSGIAGFAEDYAFLIQGLLDLYEATFAMEWLQWAEALQTKMDALFYDVAAGGYWNSVADAPDVVLRLKEDYDGAEPAPSSVATLNLLRLAALRERADWREQAHRTLAVLQRQWRTAPQALPQLLCALDFAQTEPRVIVLAGDPAAADFGVLADVVRERLGPPGVVLGVTGGAAQDWLAERAPWLREMRPQDGRAVAYVCEEKTCQASVALAEELRRTLT